MRRFTQIFSSPTGCTCYDLQYGQCAPTSLCNRCRGNNDDPNCNMRVGNRVVPRFQTQSGSMAIYATPTNIFRNAATLMPMGTDNGGFGMPMGNSGMDSYQNANGNTPIDLGGGRPMPMTPPTLGGIQITSPRDLSMEQLRKISYNVIATKFGEKYADTLTIWPYGIGTNPAGFRVYLVALNGVASNPLFFTDKSASFSETFGIILGGNKKTPMKVFFNFGRITQPKQTPIFSPNPKMGQRFQNAVGLPTKGGFNPSPYNPTSLVVGRANGRKCTIACAKNGSVGVFTDGKCYCTTHQLYGEWLEKNFNNVVGGCGDWLFCQDGYTRRACRCVPNEDLTKRLKKKKGLEFSNFFSNPFSTPKTAMSDNQCKRICARSKHQAVLVNGICTCASVNDVADFVKDKGFHNAVSGRRCREQVNCPNGWSPQVVGVDCQCVQKEAVVSPTSASRQINRI